MASTHLELAMTEHIRNLLEITQELQATNCKQNQDVQKLNGENLKKEIELDQLQNLLNVQEQELIETRLENSTLKKQLGIVQLCNNTTRSKTSQQKASPSADVIRLLIRTGCTCSFGCFFGIVEDDDKSKWKTH